MEALHAIGLDLGGTNILVGVASRDGDDVRGHERATPQDAQERVLAELGAAVTEQLDASVGAIGFGAPSPIDAKRGVVVEFRIAKAELRAAAGLIGAAFVGFEAFDN